MALTRYEPFNVLTQLQRELDRFRGEGDDGSGRIATAEWAPAVDIKEEENQFVIHADIPGVNPEDIDISMENGVLTLKGEKNTEQNYRAHQKPAAKEKPPPFLFPRPKRQLT